MWQASSQSFPTHTVSVQLLALSYSPQCADRRVRTMQLMTRHLLDV
jgi:hypothetical protein